MLQRMGAVAIITHACINLVRSHIHGHPREVLLVEKPLCFPMPLVVVVK